MNRISVATGGIHPPAVNIILPKLKAISSLPAADSRVLRAWFLEHPFQEQAELIGHYARGKMKIIDNHIETNWKNPAEERPAAVFVWEAMCRCQGEFKRDGDKIAFLFPELAESSNTMAINFSECYRFWVNYFYSCNQSGRIGTTSARLSPAGVFEEDQIRLINEKSGMSFLGQNMKAYAAFLFLTAD